MVDSEGRPVWYDQTAVVATEAAIARGWVPLVTIEEAEAVARGTRTMVFTRGTTRVELILASDMTTYRARRYEDGVLRDEPHSLCAIEVRRWLRAAPLVYPAVADDRRESR